jgi:putative addiction module killer protein
MFEVRRYTTANGVDPFGRWLAGLRDRQAVARVLTRIDRLERGLFGDCKPCGAGVWELRVDWGAGLPRLLRARRRDDHPAALRWRQDDAAGRHSQSARILE